MAGRMGAESLGQPVEKWAQVSPELQKLLLPLHAQAKQSLEAQLADELALRQGQVVKITHIIDKDWFRSWKKHQYYISQLFSRKSWKLQRSKMWLSARFGYLNSLKEFSAESTLRHIN